MGLDIWIFILQGKAVMQRSKIEDTQRHCLPVSDGGEVSPLILERGNWKLSDPETAARHWELPTGGSQFSVRAPGRKLEFIGKWLNSRQTQVLNLRKDLSSSMEWAQPSCWISRTHLGSDNVVITSDCDETRVPSSFVKYYMGLLGIGATVRKELVLHLISKNEFSSVLAGKRLTFELN